MVLFDGQPSEIYSRTADGLPIRQVGSMWVVDMWYEIYCAGKKLVDG